MAELCIIVFALANLRTVGTVQTILASTLATCFTHPTWTTYTGAVSGITRGTVFTGAILFAIQSKCALGTDLQTFVAVEARFAFALARDMIATGSIVAITDLRAILAPEMLWTAIRTNRTRPAGCAIAFAGHWVAGSAVLATAFRLAFLTVLAHRTQVVA